MAVSSAGLMQTQGTSLIINGLPVQLFGVNDDMAFVYTYWGDYGNNYNFPTFAGKISGVTNADTFWREYFRYFLHYQQTAVGMGDPKPNLLRVTVGFDFGSEDSYTAWKNDPTGYYANFDAMVKWAKAAGVYLVPMLMQSPTDRPHMWEYYNTGSARYAHLVAFERGLMTKYATESTIAMWDVFNEADVTGVYASSWWGTHGNFAAFKTWEQRLVNDVRSATTQLITVGHAMTSAEAFFPNDGFGFDQAWFNAFSTMQGVDVVHIHWYTTSEDAYLYSLLQGWTVALGKPLFVGELGYNLYPGPGEVSYGDWPYATNQWLSSGMGPVAEMTWINNGRGAYADYAYTGALPNYPSGGTFDFTVSLSPTSGSAIQGQSVSTTATATLTSGTAQAATFSASGLPAGATAAFGTTTCNPTCTSTVTIGTLSTTPTGTYPIAITGTGGGLTRTATYSVTVVIPASPCPSLPPSYPSSSWDRVWCDSGLVNKLADAPDQSLEQFDDNWGLGTVAGLRNSDVGFRSGRTLSLNAGTYTFTLGSDDGSRLWIDGTTCVDMWIGQAYTEGGCARTFSSATSHPVRIDYYEGTFNGDGGEARVRFAYAGGTAPPVDTTPPTVGGVTPTTTTVTTPTAFSATATDDVAIASCAFFWDEISQGPMTQSGSMFTRTYAPAIAGSHGARVTCVDTSGNTGTGTTTVTVTDPTPLVDRTPPAIITDLRVSSIGASSVTLQWTAPGDDGTTGIATWYDLRVARSGAITGSNFDAARHYEITIPKAAGMTETVTVSGLLQGTRYWFALTASDDVPNWSGVSNSPTALTPPDTTRPAAITNLAVVAVGPTWVTLRWNAPGDDGILGRATWYDLRLTSSGVIHASNFDTAQHYEIAFPRVAGSIEQVTVYGLRPATRYWFALRASDEIPNWSAVSNSPTALTPATAGACVFCPLSTIDDFLGTGGAVANLLAVLVFVVASWGVALSRGIARPHEEDLPDELRTNKH